jgi:hypothetical protein
VSPWVRQHCLLRRNRCSRFEGTRSASNINILKKLGVIFIFFLPLKVALVETVSKENLADIHRISDGLMSSGVWTCGNADKAC